MSTLVGTDVKELKIGQPLTLDFGAYGSGRHTHARVSIRQCGSEVSAELISRTTRPPNTLDSKKGNSPAILEALAKR